MNTTLTEAKAGIQASAQQELTAPVDTTIFTTPTLTFAEVGVTAEQLTPGYDSIAHGVGEFPRTELLERTVLVQQISWDTTTAPGQLYLVDIDHFLRAFARNWDVLRQFQLYRSDIEVTVRLNTNQFYYGALMISMWPGETTGQWVDEIAVLEPCVISASSAESVIKTWEYSWPFAWKRTDDNSNPVYLQIRNLTELSQAAENIADQITIQVWARFKNMKVSYPKLLSSTPPVIEYEAQSSSGKLKVKKPKKKLSNHPTDSAGGDFATIVEDAITAVAAEGIHSLGGLISGGVGDLLGMMAFLDKPDETDPQKPVINEASRDLFLVDVGDSNVSVSVYRDRYVDPGKTRMPMSAPWTISKYAQIPGLKAFIDFTTAHTSWTLNLMGNLVNPTDLRTPLDYAFYNSHMWRGSVKVMFQFFTSAFISARLVVQYINAVEFPGYDTDYTNGLSRVINVKGDTVETITLPWLSAVWWSSKALPQIKISLISDIASSSPVLDAKIFGIMWVAGGDDIQFAYPRIVQDTEWKYRTPPTEFPILKRIKDDPIIYEPQAAIQSMFETMDFPPIAENCMYDVDNGYCTNEVLGLVTDICKRYSVMPPNDTFNQDILDGGCLDNWYPAPVAGVQYGTWDAFRRTYYGAWRAAFLFRSGGYRWRQYQTAVGAEKTWNIQSSTDVPTYGTTYCTPFDTTARLTVPQVMQTPFGQLGIPNTELSIVRAATDFPNVVTYIAARDDLQLGYPILPSGIPGHYSPPETKAPEPTPPVTPVPRRR